MKGAVSATAGTERKDARIDAVNCALRETSPPRSGLVQCTVIDNPKSDPIGSLGWVLRAFLIDA